MWSFKQPLEDALKKHDSEFQKLGFKRDGKTIQVRKPTVETISGFGAIAHAIKNRSKVQKILDTAGIQYEQTFEILKWEKLPGKDKEDMSTAEIASAIRKNLSQKWHKFSLNASPSETAHLIQEEMLETTSENDDLHKEICERLQIKLPFLDYHEELRFFVEKRDGVNWLFIEFPNVNFSCTGFKAEKIKSWGQESFDLSSRPGSPRSPYL